jgi:HD-like signal output (HDOD) protein
LRAVPVAHQFLTKPCDATMLRVAVERACHLKALLSDEGLQRMVGELGELPALPRVYQALTRALADPSTSLQQVAKIVEQDVGISAKILQLVNSAVFGLSQSMTNVRSAVSYLGTHTLKNVVLSLAVFRAFEAETVIPGFSMEVLQRHVQLTARIAVHLPAPKHLMDVLLVSGMLHDVGKLILAWKLPARLKEALTTAREEGCPLYRAEMRQADITHAEVGAYLLGLWGLPYTVVEAVALHHAPTRVPHQGFDAVAAVYVANLLAHELESAAGQEPSRPLLETEAEHLEALGIGGPPEVAFHGGQACAGRLPHRLMLRAQAGCFNHEGSTFPP